MVAKCPAWVKSDLMCNYLWTSILSYRAHLWHKDQVSSIFFPKCFTFKDSQRVSMQIHIRKRRKEHFLCLWECPDLAMAMEHFNPLQGVQLEKCVASWLEARSAHDQLGVWIFLLLPICYFPCDLTCLSLGFFQHSMVISTMKLGVNTCKSLKIILNIWQALLSGLILWLL